MRCFQVNETQVNEGWQAVLAPLLQGELLASVNDSLEALGLPRGSSPPPLSKGQRWLAAHGLSTDLPTPTGVASFSKAQQHNAGAVSPPHSSTEQLIPRASQWSLGIAPAASSFTEGAARRQVDTAPDAVKSDIIVGAESIQPRSAESIQLQMLPTSTSDDMYLAGALREVTAAAQSPQASSMLHQQGSADVPAASLPGSQASRAAADKETEHLGTGLGAASSGTDTHSSPHVAACVAGSDTQRLDPQQEDMNVCSSSTVCGARQATCREAAEPCQAERSAGSMSAVGLSSSSSRTLSVGSSMTVDDQRGVMDAQRGSLQAEANSNCTGDDRLEAIDDTSDFDESLRATAQQGLAGMPMVCNAQQCSHVPSDATCSHGLMRDAHAVGQMLGYSSPNEEMCASSLLY